MAEMEDVERDAERNANNMTMDTFIQSPVTTNTQRNIANLPKERQISYGILAETLKGFKGLTLQSTINNFVYYNSEEDDVESNPNRDPKVATHVSDRKKRKVTDTDTNNVNSPHKLLINRLIPEIIPVLIPTIYQTAMDGVAAIGGTFHAQCTILLEDIVTDAAHSAAHIFTYPTALNWIDTYGTIPRDGNAFGMPPIFTTPVRIGDGPSVSPTRMGSQDIGSPRGSIGPQEFRDAQPLDTSINGIYSKHRDPASTWIKVIGRKFTDGYSADIT